MIQVLRPIVLLIFLAILSACGMDNNANTTVEEGGATGPLVVHVSDGDPVSQPIYSWSDGSLSNFATDLKVARKSATNVPVWEIQSTDISQDLIQSPCQHGSACGSVSELANTETNLETDVWYVVTVTKTTSGGPASREFRIKP